MDKLEQEYDYDTDEDQILKAKEMMTHENFSAVEYFVQHEPTILVGNLNGYNDQKEYTKNWVTK